MEIDSIKDLIFYLIDKPGIIDINDKDYRLMHDSITTFVYNNHYDNPMNGKQFQTI